MNHEDFTSLTEKLLFSPEFFELQEKLSFREPNFWQILGIARRENSISRFLAWMLNPKESHTFRDKFIKSFLIKALQTETGRQSSITPVDILMMDFSEVSVETEVRLGTRRCDILITSEKLHLLCILENKVDAKESLDQTKDYFLGSFEDFPLENYPHRIYVFLSPEGDLPQHEAFIPLTYQHILTILSDLQIHHEGTHSEKFLIRQFQDNILRGIAMEQKTIDLAQSIYDQYQEVFEFIFQNVERKESLATATFDRGNWDEKTWFFNIGETANSGYRWEDARKFGFICAGGAKRYRQLMERFKVGDIIYAYVSGSGYVGVATVIKKAVPFRLATTVSGESLLTCDLIGKYDESDDENSCDWIALVNWDVSVRKDQAVRETIVTPATTGRIYDFRMDAMRQILGKLELKALN